MAICWQNCRQIELNQSAAIGYMTNTIRSCELGFVLNTVYTEAAEFLYHGALFSSLGRAGVRRTEASSSLQRTRVPFPRGPLLRVTPHFSQPVSCHVFSCSINKKPKGQKKKKNIIACISLHKKIRELKFHFRSTWNCNIHGKGECSIMQAFGFTAADNCRIVYVCVCVCVCVRACFSTERKGFSALLFWNKADCVRAVKTSLANEPHTVCVDASCTIDDSKA